MKRYYSLVAIVTVALLLVSLCACAGGRQTEESTPEPNTPTQNETNSASQDSPLTTAQQPDNTPVLPADRQDGIIESETPIQLSGEVVISFDYERISGSASNQWAVWIEDTDGNLIWTLYASAWTANGGYRTRPDSLALWVEKSNLASMSDTEVDAISGATPRSGVQTYSWDLTDANGDIVSPGEYRFLVEGTLRWKNYVLFSGIIELGNTPNTVQADSEFIYEASDRYGALTSESSENAMIGAVTASFSPTAKAQG